MYGLIWFIIVGAIIYNTVKKREDKGGSQKPPHVPPQYSNPNGNGPAAPKYSNPNDNGNRQPRFQGAGETNKTVTGQRANRDRGKGGQQAVKPQADTAGSTMAYLEEKAKQDAREHAREKLAENKRLYENSGGRCAAERLYDGDPVPRGKRCVVCGYCGAQNLLPVTARERYSCYFCREPLN